MADKQHEYVVKVVWTGNKGSGTKSYEAMSARTAYRRTANRRLSDRLTLHFEATAADGTRKICWSHPSPPATNSGIWPYAHRRGSW